MTAATPTSTMQRSTAGPTRRRRSARRIVAAASAAMITALTAGCQDGQLPGVSGTAAPEIGAAVDVLVLNHLKDTNVPGATVAVTVDGRLVLSKGYGVADLESEQQMLPRHRTRIGSVSKVLTAIGAMQLVEAGKLDLDDHLYGSSATPFWGTDPAGPPGIVHANDAVLADAADYLVAGAEAVERLAPGPGASTSGLPAYLTKGDYQDNVTELLGWMTDVEVRHALSHTAGFLGSGDAEKAAARKLGKKPSEVTLEEELAMTYPEVHEAMMAGVNGRPFRFRPGADRKYSNHGFGLMGQVIAEVSGVPYVDYMNANVLGPLGLHDVVPVDVVSLRNELDATGYTTETEEGHPDYRKPLPPDPEDVIDREEPAISTSTGGWAASAQDMARIMCGVDVASNHLRLLDQDTAATMVSPAVPELSPDWVLGWDQAYRTPSVSKSGSTRRGGSARITKYLPGGPHGAEINVVVNTNRRMSPGTGLLRAIADAVADANVPDDYDLFPSAHRCVGAPPTLEILEPGDGATYRLGDEVFAQAIARDTGGDPLPVTWTLPGGRTVDAIPSPSDGRVSLFTDELPVGTHTIRARTVDTGGHEATDQVTIEVVYDAPTVAIVTPNDGANVPADSDLLLVGHSTQGAHFTLLDDQVAWEVRRGTDVVHSGPGHIRTVPSADLSPGAHTIVFTGSDGVQSSSDEVEINVVGKPSGTPPGPPQQPDDAPGRTGDGRDDDRRDDGDSERPDDGPSDELRLATATIERPDEDTTLPSGAGGAAIEVAFAGSATDVTGEPIDGTRLRWTITKVGSAPTVVCEGSDFLDDEGALDPDASAVDCSSTPAELEPEPVIGGSGTAFVVTLEARASDGSTAEDVRVVTVIIPPVS